MPFWVCKDEKCEYATKPIELPGIKPCPKCKKQMKKTEAPKQVVTFEGLAGKVKEALPNTYNASFQKQIIDYLTQKNLAGYKADFVAEMKKPEDFSKFVGKKARENTSTTDCFDNAFVRYAGAELPALCPVGEKYDFEIPYLMHTFGWKYLGNAVQCFTMKFTAMLKVVRPGYSYLVATRVNTSSTIGHTIILYGASKDQVWLHDLQMVTPSYDSNVCEAWESPEAMGGLQKPGCYLSLKTGKSTGDWVKG
jgi:hypothetical protein